MVTGTLDKPSRDPLMILRAFAILMVVIYHVQYRHVFWHINLFGPHDLGNILSSNGQVGVWMFFILSGYLIGKGFFTYRYPLSPKGILIFYCRRLVRIVPLYWLIIALLYFVIFPSLIAKPWDLIQLLTFTGDSLITRRGIGYLWAISVEMQFYLIAPFLFLAFRQKIMQKVPPFLWLLCILGVGFIARSVLLHQVSFMTLMQYRANMYAPFVMNLDLFVFGFALNLLFQNKIKLPQQQKTWRIIRIVITTVSLVLLYAVASYLSTGLYFEFARTLYAHAVLLPALTIIASGFYIYMYEYSRYNLTYKSASYSLKKVIQHPLLLIEFIGILSYSIYVFHYPILEKFQQGCDNFCTPEKFFPYLVVVLSVSSLLSLFVYYGSRYLALRQNDIIHAIWDAF